MQKGDIVNIYEDPLTKQIFEARAVLKMNIYRTKEMERWLVVFIDGVELKEGRRNIAPQCVVTDKKEHV